MQIARTVSGLLRSRTTWALILCGVAIAVMDHVGVWLRPSLNMTEAGQLRDNNLQGLSRYLKLQPLVEGAYIVVTAFIAFRIARPFGLATNEYSLIWMIAISMAVGKSFLGVGEGFSTDFILSAALGVLIAFGAYTYTRR